MEKSELPNNWLLCQVTELARLLRGVTYTKPDAVKEPRDGFFPLLRANNINEKTNENELIFVRKEKILDEQWLRTNDVLIAMSSGSVNLVGKAAQVRESKKQTFGAFCGVLRPSSQMDQAYFGWFFQTRAYREVVSADAKGSNINNLKRDHILEVGFPLPPLNEQRRIVEKIETLFARLDKGEEALREVQKLLARYRQSVLKTAVIGQLTADWRAENAHLSPEIVQGKLGDFIRVQGGFAFKSKDFCKQGVPLIRISNLTGSGVQLDDRTVFLPDDYAEEYERFLVKRGDILIAMSGATTGKMGVFDRDKQVLLNQRVGRFLPREGIPFDQSFLQFIIFGMRDQILREAYGGAQPNISPKRIEEMAVSVPNTAEEQAEIGSRVSKEFSRCDNIELVCGTELARSAALRQSILKDAFAGRLVPQDPADEPADALLARIKETRAAAPKQPRKARVTS